MMNKLQITKYMCMVEQLQWAITLDRYDILAQVMFMSRFRLGKNEEIVKASHSCIHFVNNTPTDWFLKRQATVEAATYDSEFVAAKTATEQIMDLRN